MASHPPGRLHAMPGFEDIAEGPGYLYRPRELLVAAGEADALRDFVRERFRWPDEEFVERDVPELIAGDVRWFTVPAGVDLPALLGQIRRRGGIDLAPGVPGPPPPAPAGLPFPTFNVDLNYVLVAIQRLGAIQGVPNTHGGQATPARPVARSRLQLPLATAAIPFADRVAVGVVDTGISRHPLLKDRFLLSRTGSQARDDLEILDMEPDGCLDQQAGHGTFVSGVVLRHAPDAVVLVGQALNSFGVADSIEVIRALVRIRQRAGAMSAGLSLVNLSLGAYTEGSLPPLALEAAATRLGQIGCVVVAAAGNDAVDEPFYPAALSQANVIGVAAVDRDGRNAWFSNHGPWVDASAPGVDAISTFVRFPQLFRRGWCRWWLCGCGCRRVRYDGAAEWSGTSFAAPAIAGAIAAVMQAKSIDPSAAWQRLLNTGVARDGTADGMGQVFGQAELATAIAQASQ